MSKRRRREKKALESRAEPGREGAGATGGGERERKQSGGKRRGYRPGWQGQEEVGKQRTARYLISERLQLFSQVAGGITGRKLAFTWMLIPLFLPGWQDECLLSR